MEQEQKGANGLTPLLDNIMAVERRYRVLPDSAHLSIVIAEAYGSRSVVVRVEGRDERIGGWAPLAEHRSTHDSFIDAKTHAERLWITLATEHGWTPA